MKLAGMSFFQLASQRLEWLGRRQAVVTQNIANADTPRYKAKDVSPFEEMVAGSHRAGGMVVTNTRHIQGTGDSAGVVIDKDATSWEESLDGNTVALEQQTIKAADIAGNYQLAAQLYRKGHDLITLAATGVR